MITPLPGMTTTKPGSATVRSPGSSAGIVDEQGNVVRGTPAASSSFATVALDAAHDLGRPGPLRAELLGQVPGQLLHGRRRRQDKDGYFWIVGRMDDVLNVAGHRIGTPKSRAR